MRNKWISLVPLAAAVLAGQDARGLAAVRAYALNYVRSLPDYTCVQATRRLYNRDRSSQQVSARSVDQIEEELSFVGGTEHYRVAKVNGFPRNDVSHEQLGGATSEGEFGSLLGHIFNPATGTIFRDAPPEKIQGRSMNVFAFSVAQPKGYVVEDGEAGRHLLLAYEGLVYADAQTNAVMRLSMKCTGIPDDARLVALSLTLDYKLTQLADQKFILPSHFELSWRKRTGLFNGMSQREEGTNTVDFKGYRRFTAESNIDFSK